MERSSGVVLVLAVLLAGPLQGKCGKYFSPKVCVYTFEIQSLRTIRLVGRRGREERGHMSNNGDVESPFFAENTNME